MWPNEQCNLFSLVLKGSFRATSSKQSFLYQFPHLVFSIRPTCCATLLLLIVLHDDYVISSSPTFMLSGQTTVPGQSRDGFDPCVRSQTPHPLNYRESPGLLAGFCTSDLACSLTFIISFLHQQNVSVLHITFYQVLILTAKLFVSFICKTLPVDHTTQFKVLTRWKCFEISVRMCKLPSLGYVIKYCTDRIQRRLHENVRDIYEIQLIYITYITY
jgi:hypothetical protein